MVSRAAGRSPGRARGPRRARRRSIRTSPAGLERLADLAAQDGDSSRLAELRRRKAASRLRAASLRGAGAPARPGAAPGRARRAPRNRLAGGSTPVAWWKLAARRDEASRAEAEAALARLAKAEPRGTRRVAGRSPTFSGSTAVAERKDQRSRGLERPRLHRRRRAKRHRLHFR